MTTNNPSITHNSTQNRFETTINGYTAYISYQEPDNNTLIYDHTIVPNELGGQGIGSALVKHQTAWQKSDTSMLICGLIYNKTP